MEKLKMVTISMRRFLNVLRSLFCFCSATSILLAAPVCFASTGLLQEENDRLGKDNSLQNSSFHASAFKHDSVLLTGGGDAAELLESGITTVDATDAQKNKYLIIKSVVPESSAGRSGIEPNDRVLSVQTIAGSTTLTLERAGHIYMADITEERSSSTQVENPVASALVPKPAANSIVGQYFGHLDDGSNVTTTFFLSPAGKLFGTYHTEQGGGYDGTLAQSTMYSSTAVGFNWHDRYGTGSFGAVFSPDFSSFEGSFCKGIVSPVPATLNFGHSWNGVRQ